jgi:DNA-binding transcriptional LysR family regulator
MQNLSLDDVRLLSHVAQHVTFLEAGRRLGMATTTVSRRISALEKSLGTQLVNRTHVGTELTAAGLRLVESTQALTQELEARIRGAAGADQQVSGRIKVSVAEGLVPMVLRAVQTFQQAHPNVTFTLDASNRALDMSAAEADIAIRTMRPSSEGLVLKSLGHIHFGVYASSAPSVRRVVGALPAVLAASDAVVLGGELSGLKESVWLRQCTRAVALEVDTLGALVDAVRLGIGLGVIPDELAAGDSSLRRVGDCSGLTRRTLWLVMNRQTAKATRVRKFAQHVSELLRASVAS